MCIMWKTLPHEVNGDDATLYLQGSAVGKKVDPLLLLRMRGRNTGTHHHRAAFSMQARLVFTMEEQQESIQTE